MLKDMKEGRGPGRKADLTHARTPFLNYVARPCEYGCEKYQRANYLREVGEAPHPNAADFERMREYLRATISHITQVLDAMELHQAQDPHLKDTEGMKRAAFAVDTDETPGSPVGPSLLPHLAPAAASLNMAIMQATTYGLLPADPGRTWARRDHSERDSEKEPANAYERARANFGILDYDPDTIGKGPVR